MYYLGVIGSAIGDRHVDDLAEEVGREIARQKAVLICGGRGGVMEAAARGARQEGGLVVGILPGRDRREGNRHLSVAIATGLGDARNAIIACASDALIAISGGYGTLSEIGLALKMEKPVIGLKTWKITPPIELMEEIIHVDDPVEAVRLALKVLKDSGRRG